MRNSDFAPKFKKYTVSPMEYEVFSVWKFPLMSSGTPGAFSVVPPTLAIDYVHRVQRQAVWWTKTCHTFLRHTLSLF